MSALQSLSELPVAAAGTGEETARDVELVLSAYPAGEYLLELTATGPGAGEPVKELVGFRITG